jgi:hypothetical protein
MGCSFDLTQWMSMAGKNFFYGFIIGLAFSSNLYAVGGKGGQAGAFLRLGVGNRAMGMGGAFTALANDVSAAYWNSAGLGQLENIEFALMYSYLAFDRKHNYLAASYPVSRRGSISVSWIYYGVGDIDARDQSGKMTGTFSDAEHAWILASGFRTLSNFYVGGGLKFIRQSLAGFSSSGLAADFGLLCRISDRLSLGTSFQNLAGGLSWNTPVKTKEVMPMIGRFGATYKLAGFIHVGMDYERVGKNEHKWHVGGEAQFARRYSVIAGINHGFLAIGAAALFQVRQNAFEMGYNFLNDPLNSYGVHRLSILMKLNKPASAPPAAQELLEAYIRDVEKGCKIGAKLYQLPCLIVDVNKGWGLQKGMSLRVYHKTGRHVRFYGMAEVVLLAKNNSIIAMKRVELGEPLRKDDTVLLENPNK